MASRFDMSNSVTSNQSQERTGLSACGPLRSATAVLARRSAQIR